MHSRNKFMSLRLLKPLLLVSLWMPLLAQASFMPTHLIDGFANIISWIVLIVLPIGFIALFWFVHIWPDTVAKRRQHPQRDAIHALCVRKTDLPHRYTHIGMKNSRNVCSLGIRKGVAALGLKCVNWCNHFRWFWFVGLSVLSPKTHCQ